MPKQNCLLLISHTSRPVDLEHCSLNFLTKRYKNPNRLFKLPSFETLPSIRAGGFKSYKGSLSIFNLSLENQIISLKPLSFIDSQYKIQHAAFVGKKLVICFEDFLYVDENNLSEITDDLIANNKENQIHDNWFGGLHTIFPIDQDNCIVSSAATDAILIVDVNRRKVTQRLRLPSEIYGCNYFLTEKDSVIEHYIHNDLQLGHLNCAYPSVDKKVYISTLIQGDIGCFDANGNYQRIYSGSVGCHGVRVDRENRYLYFADSCLGILHFLDFSGRTLYRYQVKSNWLHDVQQLSDDIFIFAVSDENSIVVIDVSIDKEIFRQEFSQLGGSTQFLNLCSI